MAESKFSDEEMKIIKECLESYSNFTMTLFGLDGEFQSMESPIERKFYIALRIVSRNERAFTWMPRMEIHANSEVPATDYRADFWICSPDEIDMPNPPVSFYVEVDGREYHHMTKEQVNKDYQRERKILIATAEPILRFTGSEVYNDPIKCARETIDMYKRLYVEWLNGHGVRR